MVIKVTTVITVFFSSCFCQFAIENAMRPDMTFGADNERYDVDAIMQEQSSLDMVNQFSWRRYLNNIITRKQNQLNQKNNAIDVTDLKTNDNKLNELDDEVVSTGLKKLKTQNNVEQKNPDQQNGESNDTGHKPDNKLNEQNDKGTGLLNALKEAVDQLGQNDGFAYHDNMQPLPDEHEEDFERNLQKFAGKKKMLQDAVDSLHGGASGRRGIPPDPEHEILFHYGVPVNLKLEGFLQVPLKK